MRVASWLAVEPQRDVTRSLGRILHLYLSLELWKVPQDLPKLVFQVISCSADAAMSEHKLGCRHAHAHGVAAVCDDASRSSADALDCAQL